MIYSTKSRKIVSTFCSWLFVDLKLNLKRIMWFPMCWCVPLKKWSVAMVNIPKQKFWTILTKKNKLKKKQICVHAIFRLHFFTHSNYIQGFEIHKKIIVSFYITQCLLVSCLPSYWWFWSLITYQIPQTTYTLTIGGDKKEGDSWFCLTSCTSSEALLGNGVY